MYASTISVSDKRLIDRAIKAAHNSTHKYRVGAAMLVSGRISVASNVLRNEANEAPFTEQSVHAEMRLLLHSYNNGRGGNIYVARLGRGGRVLASHPCARCLPMLVEAEVKRVVWYNGMMWVDNKI